MSTTNHAIKHGIEFALGTGTDDGDFIVRKFNNIFHLHYGIFWNFDTFSAEGDLDIINH